MDVWKDGASPISFIKSYRKVFLLNIITSALNLTYINRITLFNKVAKKCKVKTNHIYLLFIIYKFQPVSWNQAFIKLRNIKRIYNEQYFNHRLKELVALNYITRDENRLFSLTPTGLSLLNSIEKKIRNERHDK